MKVVAITAALRGDLNRYLATLYCRLPTLYIDHCNKTRSTPLSLNDLTNLSLQKNKIFVEFIYDKTSQ